MDITSFTGEYRFLSNFYPCTVLYEDMKYPSVEHAYQAAKTLDPVGRGIILRCATAAEAKIAGRRLRLRSNWEQVKLQTMELCLRSKFRNIELADKLVATGDARLIEGNTWGDQFWGVSRKRNELIASGENHLGKLLMKIRDYLTQKPVYAEAEI